MSSIFFQISRTDFVEASKKYGSYNNEFGIRIISYQNGKETYVYLPSMNLSELTVFATLLRVAVIPNVYTINELRVYVSQQLYYI